MSLMAIGNGKMVPLSNRLLVSCIRVLQRGSIVEIAALATSLSAAITTNLLGVMRAVSRSATVAIHIIMVLVQLDVANVVVKRVSWQRIVVWTLVGDRARTRHSSPQGRNLDASSVEAMHTLSGIARSSRMPTTPTTTMLLTTTTRTTKEMAAPGAPGAEPSYLVGVMPGTTPMWFPVSSF